jgi:hypothetical protein
MERDRKRAFVLILALSLALHSYRVAFPAWDYHNWRQSVTLMVARDFAEHGFRLLAPQVAWVSQSAPSYFSAEFSFMAILAALLYRFFGESDAAGRLVVISFSLLGIWALYSLLRRHAGAGPAWCGAFIYAVLPYQIFFGRVFMPEVPAQALALAALDLLDRWTFERKWQTLAAAALLASAAVLQKLTVAFLALPAAYLLWQVFGSRLFSHFETYLLAAAGVPAALWYRHAAALADQSGFAIMQPGLFGRSASRLRPSGFFGPLLRGRQRSSNSGRRVLPWCCFPCPKYCPRISTTLPCCYRVGRRWPVWR